MGASLVVIWCHKSNGIDGSLIRVLRCILWWVETRFLKSFRDPEYNWFRALKLKQISGLKISKFEKVYLGMGEVIKLPIGSHCPFRFFWTPLQKLQCVSLRKNLVSYLGQKWCFRPWDIRVRGIPRYNLMPLVQWIQWFLNTSLILHSMVSWNSLPRAI